MVRKTTRGKEPHRANWKRRITIIASLAFIVGLCILLREYSGPQDAAAQAPQRNAKVNRAVTPVSNTQAAVQAPASNTQQQNVVASVNGRQISRQELAQECLRRYGTEVLESLVNKHLIWQACKSNGLSITNADVEVEITRLAGKFGLAADRWLTMLREERGITPEQYRQEIIWPTLALRALAAQQIEVSPAELQKAYEAEYGPRIKARAITVSSRELAQELQAKASQDP